MLRPRHASPPLQRQTIRLDGIRACLDCAQACGACAGREGKVHAPSPSIAVAHAALVHWPASCFCRCASLGRPGPCLAVSPAGDGLRRSIESVGARRFLAEQPLAPASMLRLRPPLLRLSVPLSAARASNLSQPPTWRPSAGDRVRSGRLPPRARAGRGHRQQGTDEPATTSHDGSHGIALATGDRHNGRSARSLPGPRS